MTRILIVDDKEENLYYLQALLTGYGFVVDAARHGAEALVKARQSPPDVIIADLLMPVMDGYTLLRLWKADARLKQIPFIVYTATYTEPEDERLALSLGADAFILKPSEPEEFLARLRQVQANAAAGTPTPPKFPSGDEKELLKVYSETLIRKLEEKTLQLEQTNRALMQDIAERKKAEETLRLLNSAVLQAKESIVITDAQLDLPGPTIIFVNPAFTQMTGYPAQEAIGKTPRMLQGPRTDKALLRRLRHCLERGEVFEGEAIQYRKDGTEYHQEWQVAPLQDADGKVTHYVAIQRDITERKRTDQALRESEEKFSKLFQSSPMPIALSTVEEGRYRDVNKEFLKMLQRSREEVIGHTALELNVWAAPEQRAEHIARFKEQGSLRNVELDIRGKSGQITHILWSVEAVTIAGESCLLGSLLDITERKRSEIALIESNEKFHQLANNISDVFWIRSADMQQLHYISPAFEHIWGRPVAALHANPGQWVDFVFPEDRERVQNAFFTHESDLARLDIEYRIVRPDGEIRWIRVRRFQVHDAAGKLIRYIGIVTDITERKRAEEELRWKTAILEAQVDSSLDGILVVDSQGRQILQNQRMIDLWKIPAHIAGNKDDAEQVKFVTQRTKKPEQFLAKMTYLYSHPNEVSRDEIELIDGTVLDRYSSPVRDKHGNYYGRIWTFRDITEQRKLEAQFRQSQKMEAFGQLAGGVAHDFNNILAVIQLQAGLLKTESNLSLEQLDSASEIEKASARATNLTRQLLLFSRQQTMQPRELNLKDVVENISKMLRRTLGEHIHLLLKFPPQPLFIHADPGMVDQILLNLAVNARDAMPKGGEIIIETSAIEFDEVSATQNPQARPGSFICLSVSDTGCGIPAEILPRIFEPFFTTKDVGKGTGLGLATIFGIVQQHKGWITVYSEVDRGSAFRIFLPRQTEVSDTRFVRSSLPSMTGGTETILLVEDESAVRDSVRIVLSRLGYRVLEAATGDEALEIWKTDGHRIQLLLTDLMMPGGINGKELAYDLLQRAPQLKVIYASGYSSEIAGPDFRLEDGVNFLTKPFDARKLAQTIRDNLDKK
jgi:PAS domain S-box-containing protein